MNKDSFNGFWEEYNPSGVDDNPDIEMDDETEAILEEIFSLRGEFQDWLGEERNLKLSRQMIAAQLGVMSPEKFCRDANELAAKAVEEGYDAPYFSYLDKMEAIDLVIHPVTVKSQSLRIAGEVDKFSPVQLNALRKWVMRGKVFTEAWLNDHPEEDPNDPMWLGARFGLEQLEAALHPAVA